MISSMLSAPMRTMVSIDSLSIWLSESGVTVLTKLPPVTPGILRMRPEVTSAPSASRTVGRLTPNWLASSVSAGSFSPWAKCAAEDGLAQLGLHLVTGSGDLLSP